MFGPLIIDEGPSLSTTAGRAVAQLMLVWCEARSRSEGSVSHELVFNCFAFVMFCLEFSFFVMFCLEFSFL